MSGFPASVAISADETKVTAFAIGGDTAQTVSGTIAGTRVRWGAPASVAPPSRGAGDGSPPMVAVSADGMRAAAIWAFGKGGILRVEAANAVLRARRMRWSAPRTVATQSGDIPNTEVLGFSGLPQVAVSADGTRAVAVWLTQEGNALRTQTATATLVGRSLAWSGPTTLTAGAGSAWSPRVVLSADGTTAVATWNEGGTERSDRYSTVVAASASIQRGGATWGTPVSLASFTTLAEEYTDLAISADGTRATAIWRFEDSGDEHRVARVRSASATVHGESATWGAPVTISAGDVSTGAQLIALSADGTAATATWFGRRVTPEGEGLRQLQSASATITDTDARWSAPIDVGPPLAADRPNVGQAGSLPGASVLDLGDFPFVGVSASGEIAAVVWTFSDRSVSAAVGTRTALGSSWSQPVAIAGGSERAARNGFSPIAAQVAVTRSGASAIVIYADFGPVRAVLLPLGQAG